MELETDVDMSELANLPPVSISFEVTLPDEEEVVTLLQVLQEDVEGFDEMLLQAVQSIDNHEQLNQTEPQTEQNLQVFAQQHEPEPVPEQPINTTSLGRFKQLDADALLEIEQNQYSAAKKKIQSGELVRNNPMMLFFTKPTQAMIRFDVQYKSKMTIPQKGVK
jgi:hypothetical protein